MAQDFHLAKRHYDFALGTNIEVYLPITLSLFRLHARSLWHTLTGRGGGLSHVEHRQEDDADEFVEAMVLAVLCLIVSLLPYIRVRWVERLRREEQQQR